MARCLCYPLACHFWFLMQVLLWTQVKISGLDHQFSASVAHGLQSALVSAKDVCKRKTRDCSWLLWLEAEVCTWFNGVLVQFSVTWLEKSGDSCLGNFVSKQPFHHFDVRRSLETTRSWLLTAVVCKDVVPPRWQEEATLSIALHRLGGTCHATSPLADMDAVSIR